MQSLTQRNYSPKLAMLAATRRRRVLADPCLAPLLARPEKKTREGFGKFWRSLEVLEPVAHFPTRSDSFRLGRNALGV